jgi:hypothetical protein
VEKILDFRGLGVDAKKETAVSHELLQLKSTEECLLSAI